MGRFFARQDTKEVIYDRKGLEHLFQLALMDEAKLEHIKVAFGKKIKALREQKKLTQIDLATKIGVDSRHIRRIETGSTNPTLTLIYLLAEALEVEVEEIT